MSRTKNPPIISGVISDCCGEPVYEGNVCKCCKSKCKPAKPADDVQEFMDEDDDDWDD